MGDAGKDDPGAAARRQRAAARRGRIVMRRVALHADDVQAPTRGEQALSLVSQLTRAAWTMTGRPFPEHERADLPYVFVENQADRA